MLGRISEKHLFLLSSRNLLRCFSDYGARLLIWRSQDRIPSAAAPFLMEAEILEVHLLRFKCTSNNTRWLEFPKPSTMASLIIISLLLDAKTPDFIIFPLQIAIRGCQLYCVSRLINCDCFIWNHLSTLVQYICFLFSGLPKIFLLWNLPAKQRYKWQ